jgi:hypothetical protein
LRHKSVDILIQKAKIYFSVSGKKIVDECGKPLDFSQKVLKTLARKTTQFRSQGHKSPISGCFIAILPLKSRYGKV